MFQTLVVELPVAADGGKTTKLDTVIAAKARSMNLDRETGMYVKRVPFECLPTHLFDVNHLPKFSITSLCGLHANSNRKCPVPQQFVRWNNCWGIGSHVCCQRKWALQSNFWAHLRFYAEDSSGLLRSSKTIAVIEV